MKKRFEARVTKISKNKPNHPQRLKDKLDAFGNTGLGKVA
jgi:hypothetical protein